MADRRRVKARQRAERVLGDQFERVPSCRLPRAPNLLALNQDVRDRPLAQIVRRTEARLTAADNERVRRLDRQSGLLMQPLILPVDRSDVVRGVLLDHDVAPALYRQDELVGDPAIVPVCSRREGGMV